MNTMTNGRARKSLADQIDRLDRVLDGLADGLQEAVATAVQVAVKAVLAELLADQGRLQKLQAVLGAEVDLPKAAPAGPSWTAKVGAVGQAVLQTTGAGLAKVGRGVRNVAGWIVGRCVRSGQQVVARCVTTCQRVRNTLVLAWQLLHSVRHLAVPVMTSVLVGAAVAIGTYYAEPWLAAVCSGVGACLTALAVQLGLWMRQALAHPSGEF